MVSAVTLSFTCRHPETRPIGKGIMAEYDGTVLVISKGHRLTAITAEPGEEISITVMEQMIECITQDGGEADAIYTAAASVPRSQQGCHCRKKEK